MASSGLRQRAVRPASSLFTDPRRHREIQMPCDPERQEYEQAVKELIVLRKTAESVTDAWKKTGYRDQRLLTQINELTKQLKMLEDKEQIRRQKLVICLNAN